MRVLLSGMTNLLVQAVAGAISQSHESEVVRANDDSDNVATQVRSSQADVVMMPVSEQPDAEAVWPLLYQFPRLKVVTISRNGDGGFVHELRPIVRTLHELSANALNAALRGDGAGAVH